MLADVGVFLVPCAILVKETFLRPARARFGINPTDDQAQAFRICLQRQPETSAVQRHNPATIVFIDPEYLHQ